jgi:hypothetical protein
MIDVTYGHLAPDADAYERDSWTSRRESGDVRTYWASNPTEVPALTG